MDFGERIREQNCQAASHVLGGCRDIGGAEQSTLNIVVVGIDEKPLDLGEWWSFGHLLCFLKAQMSFLEGPIRYLGDVKGLLNRR
jgi:hypothetical protein